MTDLLWRWYWTVRPMVRRTIARMLRLDAPVTRADMADALRKMYPDAGHCGARFWRPENGPDGPETKKETKKPIVL